MFSYFAIIDNFYFGIQHMIIRPFRKSAKYEFD